MKKLSAIIYIFFLLSLSACKKYIDVIPDNIATIQDAFTNRTQTEKYLFTCYSYLPREGNVTSNPAMLAGDEYWLYNEINQINTSSWQIARGFQSVTSPLLNFWDGSNAGTPLFEGIRTCNIFLENIQSVQDMSDFEKNKWAAEATFLKAYYHFYLLRMYGPIPIVDKNLPVSASPDEVRIYRMPVDKCVDYIAGLLDEAASNLPKKLDRPTTDLGRITNPIALAIKARLLVMAASPLFNGNTDFASLKNNDGVALFNPTVDKKKWNRALEACKDAIEMAEAQGVTLYEFSGNPTTGVISEETKRLLTIQNAITEKWNPEIIWGASNSRTGGSAALQSLSQARLDPSKIQNEATYSLLAPTLKIAEQFYTKNGVPINEDNTWNYNDRYNLRTASVNEKFYIQNGYQTIALHFDREPRFYADLGFDGGKWYGIGHNDENNQWYLAGRLGGAAGKVGSQKFSITGYWPKKLVNYLNVITETGYQTIDYPWPIVRLADLYLMYAESANEANGPGADAYKYLDLVRARAGLKGVEESWATYSTNPTKPNTQLGLREIIQQERSIEMSFEGNRFWDLRRWKTALRTINNIPIQGWDIDQKAPESYYRKKVLYIPKFGLKDYFWPIQENNITVNRNLVQNIGW